MSRFTTIKLISLFFLFAFSAFANVPLTGTYSLSQNDCMNWINLGAIVQIDTSSKDVSINSEESTTKYIVGTLDEYDQTIESHKKGTYTEEGSYIYNEKNVSSAGTEVDYFRIIILKTSSGLRIESSINFRKPQVCELILMR